MTKDEVLELFKGKGCVNGFKNFWYYHDVVFRVAGEFLFVHDWSGDDYWHLRDINRIAFKGGSQKGLVAIVDGKKSAVFGSLLDR